MTDPRTSIIQERIKDVQNIIAVSSGKGGVGKSIVASLLALLLVRKGFKVGLFDLDFTSPSSHIILGVGKQQPKEDKGLIPPNIYGLSYMSIIYYSSDLASPLRGAETSDVLIELLTVTKWGKLDFLILDMPPGIGDTVLDLLRLMRNVKFIIVTTPSKLAFETVRKLLELLKEMEVPVVGVIENMQLESSSWIKEQIELKGVSYLGALPFDPELERNIGNVKGLLNTRFSHFLERILDLSICTKQMR